MTTEPTASPIEGEGGPRPPLSRPMVLVAVGAAGTAVMIVEMTAVRAFQPYFGSTTFVWTNVIAVVLGALALGYALGGRLADRRASPALFFGIEAVGGLLVVALALLVAPVSKALLEEGVDMTELPSMLVKGSLVASLLLLAPPVFLLGALSPIAIRFLAASGVGRAAGQVAAVSTLGSIVGTYLPTLWLVPQWGSRATLLVAAGLLVVPAAIGLLGSKRRRGTVAAITVLALFVAASAFAPHAAGRGAPPLSGGTATLLAERESPYQYLTVRDDRYPSSGERVLTINEGVYSFHSVRVKGQVLTRSRHYDDYSMLPFFLDLRPGDPLNGAIVGYACGVNAMQWRHLWGGLYRIRIDGAELDPVILDLGREFFDLPPTTPEGGGPVVADGRPWLAALPPATKFHLLVVDAFANECYVPFHLGTREFFELCRRRLEPGGVLAMKVYAVGENAPNLRAIENTLSAVFGSLLRMSQDAGTGYVLLARNGPQPPDPARLSLESARNRFGDRSDVSEWDRLLVQADDARADVATVAHRPADDVMTDDHAPLEWLTDRFLEEWERAQGFRSQPLGRRPEAHERIAATQSRVLAIAGVAWLAVLLSIARRTRRLSPAPR